MTRLINAAQHDPYIRRKLFRKPGEFIRMAGLVKLIDSVNDNDQPLVFRNVEEE